MKIAVTGTRGIPEILGGVETHCQQLFPRLAKKGLDVTVIRRTQYTEASPGLKEYEGVKLLDIPSPKKKAFEAIIHTTRAVFAAKRMKADIVHIHAVGPALVTPLARLLGLKVVMTNHGPDYERNKWSGLAKRIIHLGERLATRFANEVIVISPNIADSLRRQYGREDTHLIFNGVERPTPSPNTDYIRSLGLEPGRYVVGLARFVPEKNFHHLIEAFARLKPEGYKLVLAGDADFEDEYSRSLKQQARENGVILTGFIKGEKLRQVMSHAALFVLPSSHEGLPISLLEAMSYGRDVLVSDIPANRLPELSAEDFFPVGDIAALTAALARKIGADCGPTEGRIKPDCGPTEGRTRQYDLRAYDWDTIADQTLAVYQRITTGTVTV